jgi:hypothetical protein
MNCYKWSAVGLALMILLGGGTAGAIRLLSATPPDADPQVGRAGDLGRQFAADETRSLTEEQQKELALKLFKEMGQLSPEQRRKAFQKEFQPIIQNHIKKFFALDTAEERQAQLDKDIDQMEQLRKWADTFRAVGGLFGNRRRDDSKADGSQPSGKADDAGPGGGQMSPEDRLRLRKEWLDTTTPEQRAMMGEYARQMMQRRQERGLPTFGPGGR